MNIEFNSSDMDDAVERIANKVADDFNRVLWTARDRMVGDDTAAIAVALKEALQAVPNYEPDDAGIERLALAIHEDKLVRGVEE
jgi:hypothetical protein